LFVLSAHLPEFGRPNLLRYGIPEDHIFNKGNEFNVKRENFIRMLKASEVRLKGLPITNNGNHTSRTPICEIEAQLDAYAGDKQLYLDVEKEYELKVLIKTIDSEISLDIVGKELKVFILGDSFVASPQTFTLSVPKPGETNFLTSKIRTKIIASTDIQRLLILFYHGNNLIQQLAFDCQIL